MNTSCVPDNYEIPREDHEIGYNWYADICGRDIVEEKAAKKEEEAELKPWMDYEAWVQHQNFLKEREQKLANRVNNPDYRAIFQKAIKHP